MNDIRTLPSQIRSRKRHQYREAENTLKYIIGQIESGYDFRDEFGPRLLDEMHKICAFLRKEYEEVTAQGEEPEPEKPAPDAATALPAATPTAVPAGDSEES